MDIKLKDFEGPLDLLLHLVSKYEVDIYDVPTVSYTHLDVYKRQSLFRMILDISVFTLNLDVS